MKRRISLALAMAFAALAMHAQAVLTFDKTAHNFGTFSESTPVSFTFQFTNTGDKPLVIHQALTTCGCTVADYTKTPIKPGERGQMKVTYNGEGKPLGHFKKSIGVRSNASNGIVRIYIEGSTTEAQASKE